MMFDLVNVVAVLVIAMFFFAVVLVKVLSVCLILATTLTEVKGILKEIRKAV